MDIEFEENSETGDNPDLKKVVECRNELMNYIVQYVGEKYEPDNDDVTVELVVDAFAEDFPEFLLAVAEENWVRGYHQALADVEEGERLVVGEETVETTDEGITDEDE
jgi:hypothetical protein